jgi:hypothetical protein
MPLATTSSLLNPDSCNLDTSKRVVTVGRALRYATESPPGDLVRPARFDECECASNDGTKFLRHLMIGGGRENFDIVGKTCEQDLARKARMQVEARIRKRFDGAGSM